LVEQDELESLSSPPRAPGADRARLGTVTVDDLILAIAREMPRARLEALVGDLQACVAGESQGQQTPDWAQESAREHRAAVADELARHGALGNPVSPEPASRSRESGRPPIDDRLSLMEMEALVREGMKIQSAARCVVLAANVQDFYQHAWTKRLARKYRLQEGHKIREGI
jgi:hypothetical protein